MDAARFDGLVQALGSGTNRRRVLAGLTVGVLAGRPGWRGADAASCAKKGQKPKPHKPCCARLDLVDGRCAVACPNANEKRCGGRCVSTACLNGFTFDPTTCGCDICASNTPCTFTDETDEGNVERTVCCPTVLPGEEPFVCRADFGCFR
jgi:hypothetical protein